MSADFDTGLLHQLHGPRGSGAWPLTPCRVGAVAAAQCAAWAARTAPPTASATSAASPPSRPPAPVRVRCIGGRRNSGGEAGPARLPPTPRDPRRCLRAAALFGLGPRRLARWQPARLEGRAHVSGGLLWCAACELIEWGTQVDTVLGWA